MGHLSPHEPSEPSSHRGRHAVLVDPSAPVWPTLAVISRRSEWLNSLDESDQRVVADVARAAALAIPRSCSAANDEKRWIPGVWVLTVYERELYSLLSVSATGESGVTEGSSPGFE
jgi:hypothetical protein